MSLVRSGVGVALLIGLGAAMAAGLAAPGTGIYGTRHDFSGNGTHIPVGGLEVGLCTICHTPHSAITTSLLWNQKLTSQTFTWGDATETTGGTALPSSAHLGPSTKCLSCHDGSVAIGDTAAYYGFVMGKGAPGDVGNTGTLVARLGSGGYGIGYYGNMTGNHPVAVPYPLNTSVGTYNGVTTGSRLDLGSFVTNPSAPEHGIKLYSDDGSGKVSAGPTAGQSGIECTSCHDPHNKAAVDIAFLRGKINGSSKADGYICLQCHIK